MMRAPVNYICSGCAGLYGGEWPEGHIATFSEMPCDNCGEKAPVASVDDWNWPSGKPKKWRGAGRD